MVVLAASIINKSGKALVSRQSVDMTRTRIEGLLAAFPKLVGTGKQHTYVETENVRYVYQPMEALYLLLVTTKQSNIVEDLETLRLLSNLVLGYADSLDEESVCRAAFELIFAFDEVISLGGHKEYVTVAQVKQYCEMESHEEKLHKLVIQSKINETKDVMKRKAKEINKSKIEKNRGDKGGFGMSMQSMGSGRTDSGGFNDMSSSGGFGTGSGFGMATDMDSYAPKPKGRPTSAAIAPPKGRGMQLGGTKRTNQFLASLKAEGEEIIEDVQPIINRSKSAAIPPTDPVILVVEEKVNVTLKRDGAVSSFDIQGTLSLLVLEEKDACIQVQVENIGIHGNAVTFKTHPNIDKKLFSKESILGLKDSSRSFPTGHGEGVSLLRWRIDQLDVSHVPMIINCWPSISGSETYVSLEYEASTRFDLQHVVISIPLPALRDAPNVTQVDGEWRYDSRNSALEWSIVLIDDSNRSGSMEFVVPATDSSSFFPISVQFNATETYGGIKVVSVLPLKGGAPPKYAHRVLLRSENYQVV